MKKIYILIIAACLFYTGLHAQAGTPDLSFGDSGIVEMDVKSEADLYTAALQPDGKIIAGGSNYFKDLPEALTKTMLLRCNPDGSIDTTFGDSGYAFTKVGNRNAVIRSMVIQNDGKILAVGYAGEYHYYDSIRNYIKLILIRYNKNGKLDYSFGERGIAYIKIRKSNLYATEVVLQPDGKILVAGSLQSQEVAGYYSTMFVARFTKNGQTDSSFYNNGHRILYFGFYATVGGMALCPDGKILIIGECSPKQSDNSEHYAIVKLTASGELDAGFGKNGRVITLLPDTYTHFVNCMVLQADGKIVIGGDASNHLTYNDFTITRFTSTGIIDSSFGKNGLSIIDFGYDESLASLVIQPDGKIIAAGYSNDFWHEKEFYVLARINQSGLLDSSFNHNGKLTTLFDMKDKASAQKVLLQPDGKIIAAGFANKNYGYRAPVITRYLGDGPGIIASAKPPVKADPIKVFPNPATTLVQVTGLQKNMPTELIITDRMGNVLKKTTTTNDAFSWNIADLRNGYYYLIIQNNNLTHSVLLLKQ